MNKLVLSMVAALALCVAASAQAGGPGSSQGTQGSSPTMQGPGTQNQQPGMQTGSSYPQSGSSQSGSMGGDSAKSESKGEKKLKGCVQATGSQAMLETKKGKEVALTGQDVSAHNGHEVELKGTYESGSSMSQSSAGAGSSGEKTFNVTDVKMLSETCKGSSKDKDKGSSSMGTGANGTNPTGSGTSTGSSSGTGSGTGTSGTGTGSTQPQ